MFHLSTTLHHERSWYSGTSRERRLVYEGWLSGASKWISSKRVEANMVWEWMSPFRKVTSFIFRPITWPVEKTVQATRAALHGVVYGTQWSYKAGTEVAKGSLQATAKPLADLAYSRLKMLKGFFWDVPKAFLSAAWRMPIAFAKSPYEMAVGVRGAISSLPNNLKSVFDSILNFKFMDTVKSTRKLVGDTLVSPFTGAIKPILAPAAAVAMTILGAEVGHSYDAVKTSITHTVPAGIGRIRSAPATATAYMTEQGLKAAALEAEKKKQEEEEKAEMLKAVAEAQGKAVANDNGKAKKAA